MLITSSCTHKYLITFPFKYTCGICQNLSPSYSLGRMRVKGRTRERERAGTGEMENPTRANYLSKI